MSAFDLLNRPLGERGFSLYRMGLAVLFTFCILMGGVLSFRVVDVAGFPLSGGALVFPMAFGVLVVMAEVYGLVASWSLAAYGVLTLLCAIAAVDLVNVLPPYPAQLQQGRYFATLFNIPATVFIGTLIGFTCAEFAALALLQFVARHTKGRMLYMRMIGVPMIAQIIAVVIAMPINYSAGLPLGDLLLAMLDRILFAIFNAHFQFVFIFAMIQGIRHHERPIPLPAHPIVPDDLREHRDEAHS